MEARGFTPLNEEEQAAPTPGVPARQQGAAPAQPVSAPQMQEAAGFTPLQQPPAQQQEAQGFTAVPPSRNFREIYNDPELARVAQEFYRNRDRLQLSPRDAVAKFVSDRTWRNANTMSALRELTEVGGMDDEQKRRLAYLRRYWDSLPSFWEEGGRGLSGLGHNLVAGTLDPINVAGGVAGKFLGRGLSTASQVGISAGLDAAISSGADLAGQMVEQEVGMRENISPAQLAVAGAIGAGASAVGSTIATRFGSRSSPGTGNVILDAQRDGKVGNSHWNVPTSVEDAVDRSLQTLDTLEQNFVNRYLPAARINEAVTGVRVSPRNLVDASIGLGPMDDDPIWGPGFQARMLAGSGGRVEQFLMGRAVLPPEINAPVGRNNFEIDVAPSLRDILETLGNPEQERDFFMYLAALRAKFIRDVRNPHAVTEAVNAEAARPAQTNTPQHLLQSYLDKVAREARIGTFFDDAQVFLDMGIARTPQEAEQFAARSIDEWINWGNNQPGFIDAKNKWTQLMGSTLEYSRRRGQLADTDIDRIMGRHFANPNNIENVYVPFYPESLPNAGRGSPMSLRGVPTRAELKGSTTNRQDFLEATTGYFFRAINSADRNAFKISLYDTIQQGVARGIYEPGQLVEKLKVDQRQVLQQFYQLPASEAEAMLRRAGINTPVQATPTDEILRVIGLNGIQSQRGIDYVFRNGKLEAWRINNPEILEMLAPHTDDPAALQTMLNVFNGFARWRAAFITGNPVYVSKNAIRDTFSAGANSPLGFAPVVDSMRGLAHIIRSDINQAASSARIYTQFLADGGGYSTQVKNAEMRGALDIANTTGNMGPAQKFYTDSINFVKGTFLNRGVRGWLDFVNAIEHASRMAEYANARKLGLSGQASAYLGREVSTDFGQRGSSRLFGGFLNATSFLNAGIQGFRKMYDTLRNNPKVALPYIALLAGGDFLIHTMNADHPDYREIPAVIRAQNFLIPIPANSAEYMAWLGGEQNSFAHSDGRTRNYPEITRYVPIPKPFDFGAIGTVINGFYDAIRTNNGDNIAEAFRQASFQAIPGFNLPDFVQPFWQLWLTGKDWRGMNIVPQAMENVTGPNQFTERTPQWAIQASDSLASVVSMFQTEGAERRTLLTPLEVEFLANFAMPGLLNIVPQVATELGRSGASGERPTPRGDEFDVRNPISWITRAWQIETPGRASSSVQRFYDLRKRVEELAATERTSINSFYRVLGYSPESTTEEMRQATYWSPTIRGAAEAMRALQQHSAVITADPNLTAQQKADQLRENLQYRNEIARNTLTFIRESNFSNALMGSIFNDVRNDRRTTE